MNLNKDEFKNLLIRYRDGLCSEQECRYIESWYSSYLDDSFKSFSYARMQRQKEEIWEKLKVETKHKTTVFKMASWWKVAASIAMVLGLSITCWKVYEKMQWVDYRRVEVIMPAKKGGQLIMASGDIIDLTQLAHDSILTNDGMILTKGVDGLISYRQEPTADVGDIKYNTLITPKGQKYSLLLADGTRVTLNAGSSIRFPNRFYGDQRKVYVTGQAFFEVAHNEGVPFVAETKQQQVEVLGTKFIIDDFGDNGVTKTSLLEGRVRLATRDNNSSILLSPGQQARWTGARFIKSNFNIDMETAWLNNDFLFIENNLPTILKQLERWYDIETRFDSELNDLKFSGAISKSKSLQEVLTIMSSTGKIKFEMRGRILFARITDLTEN